jgi:hypothetical protein
LIKLFDAFNINIFPRSLNYDANFIDNVESILIPSNIYCLLLFPMDLLYKTSIPDNVTNWRFFDDDHQIISFLHLKGNFKYSIIDECQHDQIMDTDVPDSQIKQTK